MSTPADKEDTEIRLLEECLAILKRRRRERHKASTEKAAKKKKPNPRR